VGGVSALFPCPWSGVHRGVSVRSLARARAARLWMVGLASLGRRRSAGFRAMRGRAAVQRASMAPGPKGARWPGRPGIAQKGRPRRLDRETRTREVALRLPLEESGTHGGVSCCQRVGQKPVGVDDGRGSTGSARARVSRSAADGGRRGEPSAGAGRSIGPARHRKRSQLPSRPPRSSPPANARNGWA
jgi:hypothetical protein